MRGAGPDHPVTGPSGRSLPPGRTAARAGAGPTAADRAAARRATAPPPPRRPRVRPVLLVASLVGLLAAGFAAGATVLTSQDTGLDAAPRWSAPPGDAGAPDAGADPLSIAPPASGDTVSISATGDIVMGAAPAGLPPDGARNFFAGVKNALRADLQMGNLEQPLTNDTGVSKCPQPSPGASPPPRTTCFAFRSPPAYAGVLRNAGFKVLNLANNHAYDFGAEGNRQTRTALEAAGLVHTGAPGQIAVVEVKGIKIAVLGFASYSWSANVVDVVAGAALVRDAKARADLVVVQMHVGGEGADKTHVRPGTETFLGENRGDPIKFARAVVDAGADLVIGHGPHVMRAMEFYRGRLIAYSLGNFAGYKSLIYNGVVGVGGVLKVTLRKDGSYVAGSLVPTHMVAPGLPATDPAKQALSLVRGLGDADLPDSAARIAANGSITPRS
ncbi:CapA family protein [Planosporangium mesophilum]|nr:CapA family protein [Planosporangium mesophilum]